MGSTYPQQLPGLPAITSASLRSRLNWRRLAIATALVVLLHLFFFFFVAPYLELVAEVPQRTEVVQISPEQLQQLKQKVTQRQRLAPLLKQEQHKEFETKEAAKNAKMMSDINQTVPKETVAGATKDVPLDGGGKNGKKSTESKKLNLGKLGLGSKVPAPTHQPREEESRAGPPGPEGPFRPVGREDSALDRAETNMLNSVASRYYSFFLRFEEPIIRNWYFLMGGARQQLETEIAAHKLPVGTQIPIWVEFTIDKNGNFKSIKIVQNSMLPTADALTKEAVHKLGSIPNPPADLFENGQEYFTQRMGFGITVVQPEHVTINGAR